MTQSTQTSSIQQQRIETLFLRLGAIYGHLWLSNHSNAQVLAITKNEWMEGLKPFRNHILKDVLAHCRERNGYPPTLPQFIECCKAVQKRYDLISPQNSEPTKKSTPDIAKQHIQDILKYLKN